MMKRRRSFISIAMAAIVLVSLCAVCANTSVSAADSGISRANVKASPELAGNSIPASTGPSACIPKPGNYFYLFVQGYDGALWYNRQDFGNSSTLPYWGWSGWQSLGGQVTSSPATASQSGGAVAVFVRGTDGAVWSRTTTDDGRSWSSWSSLGGMVPSGTGPAACAQNANSIDVFVQGTDHALWHKSLQGSTWSAWESLGGILTSSPAAVSRGAGVIEAHVRGSDGTDWYRSYYDGAWHGWVRIGGAIASGTGPGVSVWHYYVDVSQTANREDVFVKGTDGAVWQKTWIAASGWSGWASVGGTPTSSPTAAMAGYAIELVARFSDGYINIQEYYSGAWHGWAGGSMTGPPGIL
jgi:hypothetical protein